MKAVGVIDEEYKDGVIFNIHLYSNKNLSKLKIKKLIDELSYKIDGQNSLEDIEWFFIDCDKL